MGKGRSDERARRRMVCGGTLATLATLPGTADDIGNLTIETARECTTPFVSPVA
jgi:hypothetical protein